MEELEQLIAELPEDELLLVSLYSKGGVARAYIHYTFNYTNIDDLRFYDGIAVPLADTASTIKHMIENKEYTCKE